MGHIWFTAYSPEGNGEVEYVTESHLSDYHRKTYNGTPAEFTRDVEAALHVLRWASDPCRALSAEFLAAFNAWRMAEHAGFKAEILGQPDRYGITDESDPLLAPPVALKRGEYVLGHGWRILGER